MGIKPASQLLAGLLAIVLICTAGADLVVAQPKVLLKQTPKPLARQTGSPPQTESVRVPIIISFGGLPALSEARQTLAKVRARRAQIKSLQDETLSKYGGVQTGTVKRFSIVPAMALQVDLETLQQLYQDPNIARIYEDRLSALTLIQSAPLVGAGATVGAFSGAGQTIAILDTGIESDHLFLADKVIDEVCFSSDIRFSDATVSSLCPNGQQTQTGPGAGAPCQLADAGCDHGTHVSGIAAGKATNAGDDPISGVAADADLIAAQVFSQVVRAGGELSIASFTSDQISALEYVFANRERLSIAAVNMSLGGGQFFNTCDADNGPLLAIIDQLRDAGVATVIASGNDGFQGSLSSPACISSAVAVGSTTKTDQVSNFSNRSLVVDLLAPGSSILSSVTGGTRLGFKNGTSMATPHVAGAFAVLREKAPTASVDELENTLKTTGLIINSAGLSTPRIRVDQALAELDIATEFGVLELSPSNDAAAVGPSGGPFVPAMAAYNLRNVGTAALNFSISVDQDWLSLNTSSGTLAPDESVTLTANLNANAEQLPANSVQTATLSFRNDSNPIGNASRRFILTIIGASPPNDKFSDAVSVNDAGRRVSGSNVNASRELGEPAHAGKTDAGLARASVWWSFDAPDNGQLLVDTEGSEFDTLLGIYTGNEVATLTEIASNDNSNEATSASSVTLNVDAGVRYFIAVDSASSETGQIALGWRFQSDEIPSPVRLSVTPTDTQRVSATEGGPFTPAAVNYQLHAIGGDIDFSISDVPDWLTPSQTDGSLSLDEPSVVSFTLNAQATALATGQHIASLRFNDLLTRELVLNIAPRAAIEHDDFDDARLLPSETMVVDSSANNGASFELGEILHAGRIGGKSLWWTWTAPADGLFLVDTTGSNFDTLIGVYHGNGPTPTQLDDRLMSNDDSEGEDVQQSGGLIDADANTRYHIAVDGHSGAYGNITLNIKPGEVTLANDDFNRAMVLPINAERGSLQAHNALASEQDDEPINSLGINGYHSLWWEITPAADGVLAIDTFGSDFDTLLVVFRTNDNDNSTGAARSLSEVAANDDDSDQHLQSAVSFNAEAGTRYLIGVNGSVGATGNITLNYHLSTATETLHADQFER